MNKWQLALCCVVFVCSSSEHMREKHMHLLPGRNMLNIVPDALGQTTNQSITSPDVSSKIPVTLSSLQKGIKIPVGISSLQKETSNKQVTLSSSQKRTSEIPVTLSSSLEPSKIGSVTEIALDVQEQKISDTSNMKVIPQVENKNKFGPTTRPFFDLTSLHPRPGLHHPVKHAGLPRGLQVLPMPLKDSDHELVFNVSWSPPDVGPGVGFTREYSVVVNSINKTPDCDTPMCYECCLPGNQTWAVVPSITHPVAETCAIKPGCTYKVTLTAHPWDGHTAANMVVELDECVAGVCSCAHAVRLPAPVVSAKTISVQGDLFVNVTWSLPAIPRNIRLPRDLEKKFYYIRLLFPTSHFFVLSVGKQMVSDAHPSPWFGRGTSRKVDAIGKVSSGDQPKWFMLPINDKKDDKQITVTPDVKLLARVNLIDERGCVGPAGSATAHDPTEQQHTTSFSVYALWATLGGFIFIATAAVVVVSAGAAKKVLRALRPSPVSAPLEPLRMGNAWFALQLHTRNRMEPAQTSFRRRHLFTKYDVRASQRLIRHILGN